MESVNANIGFVESIGNWMRGLGTRAGFIPVGWDHDKRPGLVWRMPDPGVIGASVFANVQGVMVREFEHAIVLQNGAFLTELESGVYDVRKMPLKDYIEVIWASKQETQHKWGVGRVINNENITVGAHGFIFLQIADPKKFVLSVVAGNRKYAQQDLEDWVFGIVAGIMRTQLAQTTIQDMMQAQEAFAHACGQRLATAFAEWGIGFKNLVVNQFDIPQEYRDRAAQATLSRFDRDKTIIDAEAKAELLRITSRAEAEARLTTGGVEVELIARMQRLGVDPIRMKAIEALTQYSKLAATTGTGEDSGSDMMKMMMFMQVMSNLMKDPGMPDQAKDLLRAQFPAQALQLQSPANPVAPAPAATETPAPPVAPEPAQPARTDAPMDRARVQQMLDNLDERLAAGEISEATYDKLRAKWEKRLEEMGG
jgi:regulator of protease activity HflC (stomatin/prohibitin superfamily)